MKIDSMARASRYLSGMSAAIGFKEAVHRIKAKSNAAIADRLQTLERIVSGDSAESPGPELALIADVVGNAPEQVDTGAAIGAANSSLADSKVLADHVRSGLPGDLAYSALLLIVAAGISLTWITSIAPSFVEMFSEIGAPLPKLSQLMIDFPWVFLALIALLAFVVAGVILATRYLTARIESIAPLDSALTEKILGRTVCRAHERWRTLTVAQAWSAGGHDPLQAVRKAAQALKTNVIVTDELTAAVSLADELGAGQAELNYQALESIAIYRNSLEWWRAFAFRFLQAAIAVLVGIIVITVYLPIFQMGAIV